MFSPRKQMLGQSRESGAILILALIFMALLLILGANAVSTTVLEEKMSGNLRNKNLSFQAAEAALAIAENQLAQTPALNDAGGLYPLNNARQPTGDPGSRAYWTDTFTWNDTNATLTTVDLTGVPAKAYYVIEALPPPANQGGNGPTEAYRITARASGGTNDAITLLQATYTR
jgi:type IV pilus assembly protein PilX